MNRKNIISLIVFSAFLGAAPVAVRMMYSEIEPFWLGSMRYLLGAAVFWILVVVKHLHLPKLPAMLGPILYGIFGIGFPFILLAWGLLETSASLASILMAMVPLMTILLSAFQCIEALSGNSILGCLVTILGTFITVGGVNPSDLSFLHIGAIILGTFFLAEGGVILKRFPTESPIMTNAIAVSISALILVAASLIAGETWHLPTLLITWAALGYLVIFVTVVAFLLYLRVLKKWSASGTSYSFVIVPIFTVIIASTLANERINPNFIFGSMLVLLGVTIGAIFKRKEYVEVKLKPCR